VAGCAVNSTALTAWFIEFQNCIAMNSANIVIAVVHACIPLLFTSMQCFNIGVTVIALHSCYIRGGFHMHSAVLFPVEIIFRSTIKRVTLM